MVHHFNLSTLWSIELNGSKIEKVLKSGKWIFDPRPFKFDHKLNVQFTYNWWHFKAVFLGCPVWRAFLVCSHSRKALSPGRRRWKSVGSSTTQRRRAGPPPPLSRLEGEITRTSYLTSWRCIMFLIKYTYMPGTIEKWFNLRNTVPNTMCIRKDWTSKMFKIHQTHNCKEYISKFSQPISGGKLKVYVTYNELSQKTRFQPVQIAALCVYNITRENPGFKNSLCTIFI